MHTIAHIQARIHIHPSIATRIFARVWIQRLGSIIPNRFNDSQSFRSPFAEQYPLTFSQVLGPLYEPKGDRRSIARPNEGTIDVDDGAGLTDGADVQHGLVLCFDGGRVREDEDLGDEFAIDFRRVVEFGDDHHAFADFFFADPFQREGG